MSLIGCAVSRIIVHPISDKDIKRIQQGQNFTAPVNGYWFSDYYVNEVIQLKIQSK